MTYAPPPDVAWTLDPSEEGTPRVLVGRLPDGPPVVLAGSAVDIWLSALECRDADEVAARVAEETGTAPDEIATAVADLLDDLGARGLLVRDP